MSAIARSSIVRNSEGFVRENSETGFARNGICRELPGTGFVGNCRERVCRVLSGNRQELPGTLELSGIQIPVISTDNSAVEKVVFVEFRWYGVVGGLVVVHRPCLWEAYFEG